MGYEAKTKPTTQTAAEVVASLPTAQQADAKTLLGLFADATGESAVVWSNNIIGFGDYHYVYRSGHSGRWMKTGFAVRKSYLVVYIMSGFKKYASIMRRLGKHKTSVSCLYINRLADVDIGLLAQLVAADYCHMSKQYG